MFYSQNTAKKLIEELLREADIEINGSRPWDIQVHNPDVYARVIKEHSLGLGESYMDGWWDCEALDQMMYKLQMSYVDQKAKAYIKLNPKFLLYTLLARLTPDDFCKCP